MNAWKGIESELNPQMQHNLEHTIKYVQCCPSLKGNIVTCKSIILTSVYFMYCGNT